MKKLFVVMLTLALAVALALPMAAPAMAATDPGLVALWRFDGAGNAIAASTSMDNSVTYDITLPTVTINQAAWQDDPTTGHYIEFDVVFSEPVTGFDSGDVILSGTAGATTVTVSQRVNYIVKVSGMTQSGTVTASIAAGGAHDAAGNGNTASTSTDNTVTYITHVTINQATGQSDPTGTSPINFTVVFSVPVTDFATGDVTLDGTAGATTAVVTGSGANYNVAVSGMTSSGTVIASIAEGAAHDGAGNAIPASTSNDNTVTYDITLPTITINQAAGQADPTDASPINFTVVFSEPVTDFATGDVTVSGTAGAITAVVTGSGANYNVAVSGMTSNGTVIVSIDAGKAHDAAGNANNASTSSDNTVTYDMPPNVTIDQAAGQADPTGASPINFTVVFSEPVTDFATGDVTLSGTAGATTAVVTGSGTTYNVAVSGMQASGTVIPSIAAGKAHDAYGNGNIASTSTDNSVTYNAPLTINQAAGQADPTNTSPINFAVVFSKPVTDFATGDVTLDGTAGATTAVVTGSGANYNVAVSGMTSSGTVIASIAEGAAHDGAGNAIAASISNDNAVTYDITLPTVTINQAAGQTDPTGASPINFTVVFSEPVTGFDSGDVILSGTAGATTVIVRNYTVIVSGMTQPGTVTVSIAAGGAHDAAGNGNTASTSTDNTVTTEPPNVTINQAAGQTDPTGASPINFTVVFSDPVTDFATGDVTVSGTAGATTAVVTGSGTTYNVAVSGMTQPGTVTASIAAGGAHNAAGNGNTASTSTDNTVTTEPPNVTINQAAGQTDPTGASPINFTVVFSDPVTDFATGDVTVSGTAGATTAVVTGSGTTYNVAVSGMTQPGTVTASIAAGGAHNAAGNGNTASTSTDNTVNYDIEPLNVTINQDASQEDPTTDHYLYFRVIFSELVTDFAAGDVTVSGTAGATTAKVVMGMPGSANYLVMVSGMTSNGTVIVSIDACKAHDAAGNANYASTSSDNTVTYDATLPTITINQATGQSDPTGTSPINFTVVFSEPVTDFATGDVTVSGTAGAITAVVTGSGTTYNVAVSGMTSNGTVIVSIDAGKAHDAAGNANIASTSTDNTVTYNNTYSINASAGSGGSITPSGNVTVNSGDNQIFTIAAGPGYHIADVKVDGASVGAVAAYTFSNATADHTIAATFAINTFTLTYTAGANGSITGTSPQTVNYGTSGTQVTAVPNTGYYFVQWSDGVTTAARTDNNVTANINVTASFAINTFTLTYTPGAGGTITGTSPQTVNYMASGSLVTALPNTGYHFVNWSDGGTTAARTDNNVTANINVTASFAINTFTLTYTPGAGGTITGTSPQTVNYMASGSLVTALPNTGYHFVNWSDGVTTADRTDSNVTANINVTASFAINTFTIAPSAGSGGTITPPGVITVNSGDSQTFTIAAGPGYHIADVKVDGATVGAVAIYTFSNVTAGHTIAASFAINTFTIAPSAGSGGTITPPGVITVNSGDSQTFTIAAGPGYHIADVKVDGATVGAVAIYTFSNVTAGHTIAASFAINTFTIAPSAGSGGTITPPGVITVNSGDSQTFTIAAGPGYHIADVKVDGATVGAVATYTFSNVTAGHTIAASFAINYGFNGLLPPYVAPPKTFKIGSSIPLKWQYTDSAGTVVDSAASNPTVDINRVGDGGSAETPITLDDPGSSGLRYDSLTMTWQFNWKTKGLAAGIYNIRVISGQTGLNGPFLIQLR